jgi:hypothetical protein
MEQLEEHHTLTATDGFAYHGPTRRLMFSLAWDLSTPPHTISTQVMVISYDHHEAPKVA